MFDHIDIDVSDMEIGDVVTVADLEEKLPESGKFLEDPARVVMLVELPRLIEEEEEEDELGLEALEGEEGAEPEVIGKGKDEEDTDE